MAGIKQVFGQFLSFGEGPSDAVMVNNADWLDHLNYIDFLRDYGRHFSVNRMLTFDSVKLRLEREQPLSFLEFNYMVLQAYDFVELARRTGCVLQMGGSDQWGNIVNGVELGRRAAQLSLYGLTTPLSSGATPRMPTWAASCGSSPSFRKTKSAGPRPWRASRSTTPRSSWPTRPPSCATAPRRPRRRPGPPARPSRKAAWAPSCRAFG
jgi:hypothetical protein